MRNIKIDGVTYKLRAKKQIPYEACEYVKELQEARMYEAMQLHKYMDTLKSDANEEEVMKTAKAAVYSSPKQLAHFMRMQRLDERLLTASLVFNIDYDELGALPRETTLTLIAEAEKEVGSVPDFLNGLGISTTLSPSEIAEMFKK
jgi:hypothetical protein